MPRPFSPATAEQVVATTIAVASRSAPSNVAFVAEFTDLTEDQVKRALALSVDLGLLVEEKGHYRADSPLCRYLQTANLPARAAILRVVLEGFIPFVTFRERLDVTELAGMAAQQTKVLLDLGAHREEVKDTLISLGTYSHALVSEGGGKYVREEEPFENKLEVIARECADSASAERRIRLQLGSVEGQAVSHDQVVLPLSLALRYAASGDGRSAVVNAGNSVESFLHEYGRRLSVDLTAAHGINAKIDKLVKEGVLPKKIAQMGKYLGNVRNAADHGSDPEIDQPWEIKQQTGLEYVFVSCSFIAATLGAEAKRYDI